MKQLEVTSDHQVPALLPRRAYTMRETSRILGVSYMSVWRLTKRGLLRSSKALRTKLFSAEEIQRFLRDTSA